MDRDGTKGPEEQSGWKREIQFSKSHKDNAESSRGKRTKENAGNDSGQDRANRRLPDPSQQSHPRDPDGNSRR